MEHYDSYGERIGLDDQPKFKDIQKNVQELSLILSSKPDYWEDLLYPLNLTPYLDGGRVSIILTSKLSQWMTKRFFDFKAFIKLNNRHDQQNQEGYYLLSALNSSRLITFIERLFYNMPYDYTDVAMQLQGRPAFQVKVDDSFLIKGIVTENEDKFRDHEIYSEKQDWTGPVYLPDQEKGLRTDRQMYLATVQAKTKVVPFSEEVDIFTLDENSNHPLAVHLKDAGYRPEYWLIRPQAIHKKTSLFTVEKY